MIKMEWELVLPLNLTFGYSFYHKTTSETIQRNKNTPETGCCCRVDFKNSSFRRCKTSFKKKVFTGGDPEQVEGLDSDRSGPATKRFKVVLESLRGPTLERADGRRGGGNQEVGVIEPSGGWRWALPEFRPSPGRCHKSPDICQVAPPPAERHQRKTVRSSSTVHVINPKEGNAKTETANLKRDNMIWLP